MKRKVMALLTAFAMTFLIAGTAFAATGASDQGVTPTLHDEANITLDGNGNSDKADCANIGTEEDPIWDGIETGDSSGSGESPSGVSVTWTYDGTTKEFSFTATGGVVLKAYIKGGNAYNEYDYAPDGVTWDGGMYAPDNASEGPAGLSHAVFCTGPGETTTTTEETTTTTTEETTTTTEETTTTTSFTGSQEELTEPPTDTVGTNGTSNPANGAWLLVVALGGLLASLVILAPAKSRR